MQIPETVKFDQSEVANSGMVELKMNAVFLADVGIVDDKGTHHTQTGALFWQETPPYPEYSNYFLIFQQNGRAFITSGANSAAQVINAYITEAGEVVYSRHRHDYRQSKTGGFAIDGGRDYVRIIGDTGRAVPVQLKFDGPVVRVIQKP